MPSGGSFALPRVSVVDWSTNELLNESTGLPVVLLLFSC